MKELKILHLYSDLLDLYGDYTNVTAVRRAAAQLGYESAVTEVQLGEPIDRRAMISSTSGTARPGIWQRQLPTSGSMQMPSPRRWKTAPCSWSPAMPVPVRRQLPDPGRRGNRHRTFPLPRH